MNNSFTVTGRIIPSHKNRPRRETRRSLPKANDGVVKHDPIEDKTTALIRGSGYRESKFKVSGHVVKHDSVKQDDAQEQGVTPTDIMIKFRRKKL